MKWNEEKKKRERESDAPEREHFLAVDDFSGAAAGFRILPCTANNAHDFFAAAPDEHCHTQLSAVVVMKGSSKVGHTEGHEQDQGKTVLDCLASAVLEQLGACPDHKSANNLL